MGTKFTTRQWFLLQDSAQVAMPALKTSVSSISTCTVSKDNLLHAWEAGGTLKKNLYLLMGITSEKKIMLKAQDASDTE
jgi:hypothetical protein